MRDTKEWVGKNDNARPTQAVLLRLFAAAGGLCQKCGIKVGPKKWHADHRIRLADGGENRENNLQVLCLLCHRDKTGQENRSGAIAKRKKAHHIGIKKPSKWRKPPKIDGMRYNPWTRKMEPERN